MVICCFLKQTVLLEYSLPKCNSEAELSLSWFCFKNLLIHPCWPLYESELEGSCFSKIFFSLRDYRCECEKVMAKMFQIWFFYRYNYVVICNQSLNKNISGWMFSQPNSCLLCDEYVLKCIFSVLVKLLFSLRMIHINISRRK